MVFISVDVGLRTFVLVEPSSPGGADMLILSGDRAHCPARNSSCDDPDTTPDSTGQNLHQTQVGGTNTLLESCCQTYAFSGSRQLKSLIVASR